MEVVRGHLVMVSRWGSCHDTQCEKREWLTVDAKKQDLGWEKRIDFRFSVWGTSQNGSGNLLARSTYDFLLRKCSSVLDTPTQGWMSVETRKRTGLPYLASFANVFTFSSLSLPSCPHNSETSADKSWLQRPSHKIPCQQWPGMQQSCEQVAGPLLLPLPAKAQWEAELSSQVSSELRDRRLRDFGTLPADGVFMQTSCLYVLCKARLWTAELKWFLGKRCGLATSLELLWLQYNTMCALSKWQLPSFKAEVTV